MREAASSSAVHTTGAAASASRALPVARCTSAIASPNNPKYSPSTRLNPSSSSVGATGRHIPVVHHRVANPIAVAAIPEHSAEIRQQKCAAQRTRRFPRVHRQHRPEQRYKPEPRKDTAPRRHRSCQRKRQFQQARRQTRRSPQLPPHRDPYAASLKHPRPAPPQPARHGHFTAIQAPLRPKIAYSRAWPLHELHENSYNRPHVRRNFWQCVSSRSCSSSAWQDRPSLSSSASSKTQRNSSETNNASGHLPLRVYLCTTTRTSLFRLTIALFEQ